MIWAWGYLWGRCLIINLFSRYSDFPVDFISYGKLCFSVSLSIFFKVFEFIGLRLLLLFSCVWLFEIPWAAACQASLSLTISWSLFKLKEFTFHNILYYIFNVCRSFSDSALFIITLLTCSFSLSLPDQSCWSLKQLYSSFQGNFISSTLLRFTVCSFLRWKVRTLILTFILF